MSNPHIPTSPAFPRILFMRLIVLLAILLPLAACNGPKEDPWEPGNRAMYDLNENMDHYALKPISDFYVKVIPKPVRTGLSNGFDNLGYADVILSDFLQANWNQGVSDCGRMALNSTVGIAGFFDVATPCGMPSHENDFGITLAKWGVEQGPYIVIPLFGPSTLRDVPDFGTSLVTDPTFWLNLEPPIWISLDFVRRIDARSRYDKQIKFRNAAAIDPYVFTRDAYIQYRNNLIYGAKPKEQQQDIYDEDTGSTTQPATQAASQPASQPASTQPAVNPEFPGTVLPKP